MGVLAFLAGLRSAEASLAQGYRTAGDRHIAEPDVYWTCRLLADQCDERQAAAAALERARATAGGPGNGGAEHETAEEMAAIDTVLRLVGRSRGPLALLLDLQYLHAASCLVASGWMLLGPAAQGLRDRDLLELATASAAEAKAQQTWLLTRMKSAAPQLLVLSE